MTLCASCGLDVYGDTALCPHHHAAYPDDWARANRIQCDFFHRGIAPKRLAESDRAEDESTEVGAY